jgi:hypothetical protein
MHSICFRIDIAQKRRKRISSRFVISTHNRVLFELVSIIIPIWLNYAVTVSLNNHYFISDYIKRNNAGRIYGVFHITPFCSQIKLACTQYVNACKYFKWSNWNLTKSNWIYCFETCVCDARPFESGTKSNRCTAFVFHGAAKRSVPISLRLETVLRLLITAKETFSNNFAPS